jgi:hypothetical protein
MPRVALPDSLQLCKISGCLYTPHYQRSTLFRPASSSTGYRHQNYSYDIIVDNLYTRRDFRDFAGYPQTEHCCLRPLRGRHAYKGLPEVGPARLLASMLGNLGASTLRSIKTMPSFFFSFWSINQPCCLLQCSGTTL